MGFLSSLLVWTFVCPLWRERHSLGMLSVLFMVVNCSWTSRELISDFLAVFCFPCFETGSAVPEELWNQRQQVYFKRMWQTIQEFLCPQSEVWYNHCREFWPWTSQAFTGSAMYWPSLRGQRWKTMSYFYPPGAFLPEEFSHFKFYHLAIKSLLIPTMPRAGLEL